jgi:hypothetical protein
MLTVNSKDIVYEDTVGSKINLRNSSCGDIGPFWLEYKLYSFLFCPVTTLFERIGLHVGWINNVLLIYTLSEVRRQHSIIPGNMW